jgi:transcriptional regulatory protein LevR
VAGLLTLEDKASITTEFITNINHIVSILNSLSLYQVLLNLVNEFDLSLKVTVFWGVTPHSLGGVYHYFGGAFASP